MVMIMMIRPRTKISLAVTIKRIRDVAQYWLQDGFPPLSNKPQSCIMGQHRRKLVQLCSASAQPLSIPELVWPNLVELTQDVAVSGVNLVDIGGSQSEVDGIQHKIGRFVLAALLW